MSKCPFATQLILPESATQRAIVPRIIIDHTQAGSGSLYNFWLNGSNLESTYGIRLSGEIEQFMDDEVQSDANYKANRWHENGVDYGAISVETENSREATQKAYRGGEGAAAFDRDPMTPEQVAAKIKLYNYLAETHPAIKRQRCDAPLGSGLGYHSMWGTGPTPWIPFSSRGKKCPGDARIKQFNEQLLPAFIGGNSPEEDDMTPDQVRWLRELHGELARPIAPGGKDEHGEAYPFGNKAWQIGKIVKGEKIEG